MEKVFEQKITIANITPTKNYSRLCDRPRKQHLNTFSDDLDLYVDVSNDSFGFRSVREVKPYNMFLIEFICPEKRKKKIKYFYNEGGIDEKIELKTVPKFSNQYFTSNERHIIEHYGNPFTRIEIDIFSRTIYKSDEKIVVKTYHKRKLRSFNWKFFKTDESSDTLSFNLKTGNINFINKDKKLKKNVRFRTNNFSAIKNYLASSGFKYSKKNILIGKEKENFLKIFNEQDFVTTICDLVLKDKNHGVKYSEDNKQLYELLIKDFIDKRGIKPPNNYIHLLENFYPKVKILKKNDNKLGQAVLDMLGIKCKSTIKLLHENPTISLGKIVEFSHIFGSDFYHYINKIPLDILMVNGTFSNKYSIRDPVNYYELTKDEKDNVLNFIIDVNTNHIEILIYDHMRMISEIRSYFPDTKFSSRTKSDFDVKHSELANILSKVHKGFTTEYQFEKQMLDEIESKFAALKNNLGDELIMLKPYILKRDDDYNEEGEFMHHCVASYANSGRSIIISLRTLDNIDRVTCEFNMGTGKVIQKRHFCNKNPPEHFLDGLLVLEEKVTKYARWGMLAWREKKQVPVIINGVEVVVKKTKPREFQPEVAEPFQFDFNF